MMTHTSVLLVISSLLATQVNSSRIFWRGKLVNRDFLGVRFPQVIDGKLNEISENWFQQRLDHNVQNDARMWWQRYFVNTNYFKPGGPVFIMIGGEGPASVKWMSDGNWITLAKKMGALCFQLEHRYYGKSWPTLNMSVENLKWLTSDQALADIAVFVSAMNQKFSLVNPKWVAFGGSYSGSLSAWLRLKYPHLIYAAVSSSAPILAQVDFKDYFGVVTKSLLTTKRGRECVNNIKRATTQLHDAIEKNDVKKLQIQFKMCEMLNSSNKLDVENFKDDLAGNFAGIVQYNRDNRNFNLTNSADEITIDTLCDIMVNQSRGDYLQRYADVNSLLNNQLGTGSSSDCQQFSYSSALKSLSDTTFSESTADRQWIYQTCNEFGFYQTSDLKEQPFGNDFPLNLSVQICKDVFGSGFDLDYISNAVNATNIRYGGKGIEQRRIVFINGSIDPWHALGLTKQTAQFPDNIVIFINGTAHCANMYPASANDLPQLTAARLQIAEIVQRWLVQK